ncbi:MAG: hypothetical protein LBV42_05740 [Methanobrevibacter sp.]|jgi:hypothetical protein|nr:hypothetical protein [Methanobrevibacter sp.]
MKIESSKNDIPSTNEVTETLNFIQNIIFSLSFFENIKLPYYQKRILTPSFANKVDTTIKQIKPIETSQKIFQLN